MVNDIEISPPMEEAEEHEEELTEIATALIGKSDKRGIHLGKISWVHAARWEVCPDAAANCRCRETHLMVLARVIIGFQDLALEFLEREKNSRD
mmetsp:Transcript_34096/g.74752  ORF Transcript_34096/g.74752 Transcript_34096/m.74752 type:complete len:94 (+) Transcript_34096:977-1258(+)